jgi:cephalosporin hydroxylase
VDEQELIDRFHLLWYEQRGKQTWRSTYWLGTGVQQCPLDLWIYQELIHRVRPDVFVEVGIKRGGLTRFIADVFTLLGRGKVVGVDLSVRNVDRGLRRNKRVKLLAGDSVDARLFGKVERECRGKTTMVLLDSDHRAAHVRKELDLYGQLVTPGSYLIVNDTNINGHPALVGNKGRGPGPYEAVEDFLASTTAFELDPTCERYLLTMNPRGYLRRV